MRTALSPWPFALSPSKRSSLFIRVKEPFDELRANGFGRAGRSVRSARCFVSVSVRVEPVETLFTLHPGEESPSMNSGRTALEEGGKNLRNAHSLIFSRSR